MYILKYNINHKKGVSTFPLQKTWRASSALRCCEKPRSCRSCRTRWRTVGLGLLIVSSVLAKSAGRDSPPALLVPADHWTWHPLLSPALSPPPPRAPSLASPAISVQQEWGFSASVSKKRRKLTTTDCRLTSVGSGLLTSVWWFLIMLTTWQTVTLNVSGTHGGGWGPGGRMAVGLTTEPCVLRVKVSLSKTLNAKITPWNHVKKTNYIYNGKHTHTHKYTGQDIYVITEVASACVWTPKTDLRMNIFCWRECAFHSSSTFLAARPPSWREAARKTRLVRDNRWA